MLIIYYPIVALVLYASATYHGLVCIDRPDTAVCQIVDSANIP